MADNFSSGSLENLYQNENSSDEYINAKYNHSSSESQSDNEQVTLDMENQNINFNKNLEERFKSLKNTMQNLNERLAEEKKKWKEEIEETKKLATPDGLMKSQLVDSNNIFSREINNINSTNLTEGSLTEYDERLSTYQNAIAEKRASFRRHMAINNYKRRLLEVENMCNLELLRVKQSVQFLQPLQIIASEWNNEIMNSDEEISGVIAATEKETEITKQKDTTFLESLSSKVNGEFSDIFAKLHSSNFGLQQLSEPLCSLWPEEGDIIATQSTMWYTTDST